MIFFNPNVHFEQLDDNFYFIINLLSSNTVKIINKNQFRIIQKISAAGANNPISKNIEKKHSGFLNQLHELDFINTTGVFSPNLSNGDVKSLNFWIHTTDLCNLKCHYCYIRTKENKTSIDQKTRTQITNKILETVSKKSIKNITIKLAGGEPLIVFDKWTGFILNLKEELLKLNCTLNSNFLTNLTLFPENFIDFIKLTDSNISVSLDGLEQFHDKTRKFIDQKGSFNIVKNNIIKLRFNNITPFIMTVLSNDNLDGIVDFTKWLVDQELPFRFSIVHNMPFDYQKAFSVLSESYKYIEQRINEGYPFSNLHRLCDLKFNFFSNKNCGCGKSSGTIYSDGNIYYCQKLLGTGDFLENIYSSNDLMSIISMKKQEDELIEECIICKYRFVCNGGCPLSRVSGKNPACEFYKKIIPIIYRLIGLERLHLIYNNTYPLGLMKTPTL